MPKFSANIEMMFRELPFIERVGAAARAGFRAIEAPWPFAPGLDAFSAAVKAAGVEMVELNIPTGDILQGGFGLASVPGRQAQFREAVEEGRRWALTLGARKLNVLAGFQAPWASRQQVLETLAENLDYAARTLADDGIMVLMEACNRRERPGYVIGNTAEVLEVMTLAGHGNIRIEHDIYHLQIAEGDLAINLRRYRDFIGHIQFADTPGRHEPGTGEINFPFIFNVIDEIGYTDWCGAEYFPSTSRTEDSLGWFAPYRDRQ